jgi:hypothetical protein
VFLPLVVVIINVIIVLTDPSFMLGTVVLCGEDS